LKIRRQGPDYISNISRRLTKPKIPFKKLSFQLAQHLSACSENTAEVMARKHDALILNSVGEQLENCVLKALATSVKDLIGFWRKFCPRFQPCRPKL
jgi:hypothetical protein